VIHWWNTFAFPFLLCFVFFGLALLAVKHIISTTSLKKSVPPSSSNTGKRMGGIELSREDSKRRAGNENDL
jgi:hypothetical protein